MSFLQDNIRARMLAKGLNAKRLSTMAGLSETAVRDILQRDVKPRTDTVEAIARILGCDGSDLLADPTRNSPLQTRPTPVIGAVEAGAFKPAIEWPQGDWMYEPIPDDPRFIGKTRFGLAVRGRSMDMLYREGDIVICVPMIELQEAMFPGRRYVVYRHQHGETEATLKEYFVDPDGGEWLLPKSTDPAHQTPIRMGKEADPDVDVEVYARVTGVWSKEP